MRPPRHVKAVNLALQGGGAHGAFTWGVLDKLLEEDRLWIKAANFDMIGVRSTVNVRAMFRGVGNLPAASPSAHVEDDGH